MLYWCVLEPAPLCTRGVQWLQASCSAYLVEHCSGSAVQIGKPGSEDNRLPCVHCQLWSMNGALSVFVDEWCTATCAAAVSSCRPCNGDIMMSPGSDDALRACRQVHCVGPTRMGPMKVHLPCRQACLYRHRQLTAVSFNMALRVPPCLQALG